MARLPVSYTSSLSFCHSSHVVVLCTLFCYRSYQNLVQVYVEFFLHTHEKLVPVSPVQRILCTYCQIIFV